MSDFSSPLLHMLKLAYSPDKQLQAATDALHSQIVHDDTRNMALATGLGTAGLGLATRPLQKAFVDTPLVEAGRVGKGVDSISTLQNLLQASGVDLKDIGVSTGDGTLVGNRIREGLGAGYVPHSYLTELRHRRLLANSPSATPLLPEEFLGKPLGGIVMTQPKTHAYIPALMAAKASTNPVVGKLLRALSGTPATVGGQLAGAGILAKQIRDYAETGEAPEHLWAAPAVAAVPALARLGNEAQAAIRGVGLLRSNKLLGSEGKLPREILTSHLGGESMRALRRILPLALAAGGAQYMLNKHRSE